MRNDCTVLNNDYTLTPLLIQVAVDCFLHGMTRPFYGIPEDIIYKAIAYLDSCEMEILYTVEKLYPSKVYDAIDFTSFDILDDAIDKRVPDGTPISYLASSAKTETTA